MVVVVVVVVFGCCGNFVVSKFVAIGGGFDVRLVVVVDISQLSDLQNVVRSC